MDTIIPESFEIDPPEDTALPAQEFFTSFPDGSFPAELGSLINKHSIENGSNTPDFILAEYLKQCLITFDMCTRRRDSWYGFESDTGKEPGGLGGIWADDGDVPDNSAELIYPTTVRDPEVSGVVKEIMSQGFKIIETDNFGGDYPDEKQLPFPPLRKEQADAICTAIQEQICSERHSRYYWVKPWNYVLQPGFEP